MQDDRQGDVLRRLRGVAQMIEYGDDCPAVLRQIMALHGFLDEVSDLLLDTHQG
jgi:DNA-binding FrmR family transcriptional regulator